TANYSGIVFASDKSCFGCDSTAAGEVAINNRSEDIQAFFDAGGGLVYLTGGSSSFNFVPVPGSPTLSSVSVDGGPGAANYFVKITYTTPNDGETTPSLEATLAVLGGHVLSVMSPPALSGASGYNVYVSNITGTETKQNVSPIA